MRKKKRTKCRKSISIRRLFLYPVHSVQIAQVQLQLTLSHLEQELYLRHHERDSTASRSSSDPEVVQLKA